MSDFINNENLIRKMKDGKCFLKITSYNYSSQSEDNFACHTAQEIALFFEGSGEYFIDGKNYSIEPGSIFFIPGGKNHFIKEIKENIIFVNIWFDPVEFVGADGKTDACRCLFTGLSSAGSKIAVSSPNYNDIKNTVYDIYREAKDKKDSYYWMIKTLMCRLIILLSREYNIGMEKAVKAENSRLFLLEQSMVYINDKLTKEFTLEELAGIAGVSPVYYCKIFKKHNGVTVWTYINAQRVLMAQEMLKNTNNSVIDISISCGFNTTANFNKVFKKHTGFTPTEYRDKERGSNS